MGKTKFKSKIQMTWEISREQEQLFRKGIPEIVDGIDTDELFKLIRGSEYRRGKEDAEKELAKLIKSRIKTCHGDLLFSRDLEGYRKDWIEGFRSRLDELILIWHEIYGIDFITACKELGINYKDVNTEDVEHKN